MLHSPPSFEVCKPSLAGINQACTGEFQHSWQTESALSLLTSCCLSQRTQILDVNLHRWTPVRVWDMGWYQCTPSSKSTTLESNMSLFFIPTPRIFVWLCSGWRIKDMTSNKPY